MTWRLSIEPSHEELIDTITDLTSPLFISPRNVTAMCAWLCSVDVDSLWELKTGDLMSLVQRLSDNPAALCDAWLNRHVDTRSTEAQSMDWLGELYTQTILPMTADLATACAGLGVLGDVTASLEAGGAEFDAGVRA